MSRRFETEDERHDRLVVEYLDDEVEARAENAERNRAKRAASRISKEELSLQDAFLEGVKAGRHCNGASMNPYQEGFPEYKEWERGRTSALAAKIGET